VKAILSKGLAALLIIVNVSVVSGSEEWWNSAPPPESRSGQPMPADWWQWVKEGSKQHGSDPFVVAAVMDIEANGWHQGRLGRSRYVGPCGFNLRCQIPKEVFWNPELQIKWACRRLAGDYLKRLKIYNKAWHKNNYLGNVKNLSKKMRAEAHESRQLQQTGQFNLPSFFEDSDK